MSDSREAQSLRGVQPKFPLPRFPTVNSAAQTVCAWAGAGPSSESAPSSSASVGRRRERRAREHPG